LVPWQQSLIDTGSGELVNNEHDTKTITTHHHQFSIMPALLNMQHSMNLSGYSGRTSRSVEERELGSTPLFGDFCGQDTTTRNAVSLLSQATRDWVRLTPDKSRTMSLET
jgi:hypothetical protein